MHDARSGLVAEARVLWPEHDWENAEFHSGAFHRVLLSSGGLALRATVGRQARTRTLREVAALTAIASLGLSFAVPQPLSAPRWVRGARCWIAPQSVVPGSPASDLWGCSPERLTAYAEVLTQLRSASGPDSLPHARAWCGGARWPELVTTSLLPRLEAAVATAARDCVDAMLDSESDADPVVCHGDFGPHNILWEQDQPLSLLDFDHACVGDPAIDLAPLIGFHGLEAVAGLGAEATTVRAMRHRATHPLQVAAAAHLAGLASLRDHALGNFARRCADGTLYDPGGARPE